MYIQKDIDRFWSHVDIKSEDECWNWTLSKDKDGYGKFKLSTPKKIDIRAHRFSYLIYYNNLPNELYVCHSCDNPSCVNPKHLWLGTNRDNQIDVVSKGRYNHSSDFKKGRKGIKNHSAKITEEDVIQIRKDYFDESIIVKDLIKKYNLSRTEISYIAFGKTWNYDGYTTNKIRIKGKVYIKNAND